MLEAVSDWPFFSKEHASFVLSTQISKNYFPFWKGKRNENHSTTPQRQTAVKTIWLGSFLKTILCIWLDQRVSVKRQDLLHWVIILKYLPITAHKHCREWGHHTNTNYFSELHPDCRIASINTSYFSLSLIFPLKIFIETSFEHQLPEAQNCFLLLHYLVLWSRERWKSKSIPYIDWGNQLEDNVCEVQSQWLQRLVGSTNL